MDETKENSSAEGMKTDSSTKWKISGPVQEADITERRRGCESPLRAQRDGATCLPALLHVAAHWSLFSLQFVRLTTTMDWCSVGSATFLSNSTGSLGNTRSLCSSTSTGPPLPSLFSAGLIKTCNHKFKKKKNRKQIISTCFFYFKNKSSYAWGPLCFACLTNPKYKFQSLRGGCQNILQPISRGYYVGTSRY